MNLYDSAYRNYLPNIAFKIHVVDMAIGSFIPLLEILVVSNLGIL